MKFKGDPEIGSRAGEQIEAYIRKNNISVAEACKQLDIPQRQFYWWKNGIVPDSTSLQALALAGLDVHYILTGQRGGPHAKPNY